MLTVTMGSYCWEHIVEIISRFWLLDCDTLCDAYHWVNYASVCYIFVGKDNLQHASLIAAMLDVKYVYIANVAWQLCCVGFLPRVVSFRCSDSSCAWWHRIYVNAVLYCREKRHLWLACACRPNCVHFICYSAYRVMTCKFSL